METKEYWIGYIDDKLRTAKHISHAKMENHFMSIPWTEQNKDKFIWASPLKHDSPKISKLNGALLPHRWRQDMDQLVWAYFEDKKWIYHRTNGPAIIRCDGKVAYALKGQSRTKEEVFYHGLLENCDDMSEFWAQGRKEVAL
jgi:hypothetical protein